MRQIGFILFAVLFLSSSYADVPELDVALSAVRENCSGIASELNHMKTMAGINTAVTGVGTLAGGGAIATGFVKASKDKDAEQVEIRLQELRRIESKLSDDLTITTTELQKFEKDFDGYLETAKADIAKAEAELNKLTGQSKSLGNWRTGLMAGSTATNVAGAIIAGGNKVQGDLKSQIEACRAATDDLRKSSMQARMDGRDITAAQKIIDGCKGWETFDASKINDRASGAKWSSIIGAATGAAGTITSAVANTDKTRQDDTDSGKAKEKNLNTASNVLAIGTTAASATATVFNATQISAIKKASEIADNCERALQ